jgi:prepilin peptidase CpaA
MAWIHVLTLGSFLACAVVCDVRQRRVPNALVAAFTGAALLLAWAGDGGPGVARAAGGFGLGLGLLLIPVALGQVGGGDAKFFGAIGAFLGPRLTLDAFLAGSILGGIATLLALRALRRREAALPYTAPLAAGVVVALALDRVGIGLL